MRETISTAFFTPLCLNFPPQLRNLFMLSKESERACKTRRRHAAEICVVASDDVLQLVVQLYEFLWGFTQERHEGLPRVRQPVTGMYLHPKMPWFIRAGAIGLFLSLGLLAFRTIWSGLYLAIAPRPYVDVMEQPEASA